MIEVVSKGGRARELTQRLVQVFDTHNERGRDDDLTILAIVR